MKPINTLGAFGAYNLRQETFADAVAISGEEMEGASSRPRYHLPEVPGGLRQAVRDSRAASSQGLKAKMPEYETIFAFGSMLGNAHAAPSPGPTTCAISSAWTPSRWA